MENLSMSCKVRLSFSQDATCWRLRHCRYQDDMIGRKERGEMERGRGREGERKRLRERGKRGGDGRGEKGGKGKEREKLLLLICVSHKHKAFHKAGTLHSN